MIITGTEGRAPILEPGKLESGLFLLSVQLGKPGGKLNYNMNITMARTHLYVQGSTKETLKQRFKTSSLTEYHSKRRKSPVLSTLMSSST